jgi:hypothetical protein
MEQLVASLLLWLASNSTFDVAALKPPPIVLMSPEEMTSMYYRESGRTTGVVKVDARVQGYFRRLGPEAGTVYVISPENVPGAEGFSDPKQNPIFQERLLHELVHYVQWSSGEYERFICPAQGELAAYQLGGRFLRSLGATDPIKSRDFWIPFVSRC